ncbi:protein kinase domain-containing protein [Streptomyces boninensis]|uniref:protein kinase domain-containing protein n=1 Tax=Streptomyces boninensis TaxID=2039455 RepID=UPI003B21AD52
MRNLGPEDPSHVGEYRLLGRLGEGGMGRVYLARSARGRTVAVKLVQEELAREPEFRRRFAQEVTAARRVGGEWTAPVLDADTTAHTPWVATGYVAGPSLYDVVATEHGPLPAESVLALASGLTRALETIHGAGLVHRDLKPSNILVTIDGPKVIDFGIARALDSVSTAGGLTRTGAVIGSPGFMSPEQVRGERVTTASDVFCLGSVLAFAATGRMPFGTHDSGAHALLFRIAQEEPDLTGLDGELLDLVRRCLVKDPAGRPTIPELLELTAGTTIGPDIPWLPAALLARLGRLAVELLDVESPQLAPHAQPTQTAPPGQTPHRPVPYVHIPGTPPQQMPPSQVMPQVRTPPPHMGTPPPPVGTPLPGYARRLLAPSSPRALGTALVVLLSIGSAVQVMQLIFHLNLYGHLSEDGWLYSGLTEAEENDNAFKGLYILFLIPTIVLWTVWFHRLRTNAEYFAPNGNRFAPGMAAGSWFIPVVYLFMPKMIANDIWKASAPAAPTGYATGAPGRGLLNAWWIVWLPTTVLFFWDWDRNHLTADNVAVDMIQDVVTVAAGVLALLLVRKLSAMQDQRITATGHHA